MDEMTEKDKLYYRDKRKQPDLERDRKMPQKNTSKIEEKNKSKRKGCLIDCHY